jgi:O-antigen/teichoic acid export membrane protein
MTELRKHAVRIAANYLRLGATVVLGLILIRVLLATVGEQITGLIDLLGSTIGLATIIDEIIASSMIRELGAAHHSGSVETFRRMYNSALVVSAGVALATLGMYAVILAILPLVDIPAEVLNAARWFVIAKAIESACIVLLAPLFNMYLITERQVSYNFWLVVKRATLLLAAVALIYAKPSSPAAALVWFGWLSCSLHIAFVLISSSIIVVNDRRTVPKPRLATPEDIRTILHTSGWNMAILGSQSLGLPASQIIVNLHFGILGNLMFGRAAQLGGYARMLTNGISHGLDAVAVRLSSRNDGNPQALKKILYDTMRLQGLIVFPVVFGLMVLVEPIFGVWISERLDSAHLLPSMIVLTRILLIGFLVMALSDNWIKLMYGAGHVRRYAPIVVFGGILNLTLALLLIRWFPNEIKYTAVAWAFSLTYLTCYLMLMARVVAETLDVTLREIFSPLLRPLLAAVTCAPVLMLFVFSSISQWNLAWLLTAVTCYGLCYLVLCWVVMLNQDDRARLWNELSQRSFFR